ncbi:MAG: hypothetical protein IBJ14_16560 [Hydrogenophaga sp.]|nr:hypothetical protein [Hydrogenophaga sp.]
MLSLYTAQDANKIEFEIFGYGFKNLGHYKEFLLFLAALTSPISATISAYHRYLSELRAVALQKLYPDKNIREFYSHIYIHNLADPLIQQSRSPHVRPHGFTLTLAVFLGLFLLALAIAFIVASFILQIAVVYDVAINPASSKYINLFVVAFSLTAISLSWLIGILQLPLPEVDLSAYVKLSALRETNRAKYDETMARLALESAKRERIWSIGSSIAFFAAVYGAIAVFVFPSSLQDLGSTIAKAMPGLVLAILAATALASRVKHALYRQYFRRYPRESDTTLRVFSRYSRLVFAARFTLPVFVSTLYALLVLGRG